MYTKQDIETGKVNLTMFNYKVVKITAQAPYAAAPALLQVRRVTSRYAPKGTFSSNQGYIRSRRDPITGRFVSA